MIARPKISRNEWNAAESGAFEKDRARRCARLWCVSDLHLDCPGNEGWLGTLEARPDDALIVAGDAAVRLDELRAALATLAGLYKHVVFVPGNHELWLTNASGSLDATTHADSIAKFFAILELCDELCGNQPLVWGVPTKLQNSLSRSNRSRFG